MTRQNIAAHRKQWSILGACLVLLHMAREGVILSRLKWEDDIQILVIEDSQLVQTFSADFEKYSSDENGIISDKEISFFRSLQSAVDQDDPTARCARYGFRYNETKNPIHRRIFYGALIADETQELLEIVATEAYEIYTAMVLVEGNRTQNFTPRRIQRLGHGPYMARLFGVEQSDRVQVRAYVNEDESLLEMDREHDQRSEILKGWKDLGMRPTDVGLLADMDETYSRDFLRALQTCDGIDALDYEAHHCQHDRVKLVAVSRVFEGSPECPVNRRSWYHPDVIVGHCIEGIADEKSRNKPAPRAIKHKFMRAFGYGRDCRDWDDEAKIRNGSYPLWNAADFRRTCGGKTVSARHSKTMDQFTAFHFHNFVSHLNSTRFKYATYAHHDARAATFERIGNLSQDLKLMHQCVTDGEPPEPKQRWKRVPGGYKSLKPAGLPIYFQDADYRKRRHAHVRAMVEWDDRAMDRLLHRAVQQ